MPPDQRAGNTGTLVGFCKQVPTLAADWGSPGAAGVTVISKAVPGVLASDHVSASIVSGVLAANLGLLAARAGAASVSFAIVNPTAGAIAQGDLTFEVYVVHPSAVRQQS